MKREIEEETAISSTFVVTRIEGILAQVRSSRLLCSVLFCFVLLLFAFVGCVPSRL